MSSSSSLPNPNSMNRIAVVTGATGAIGAAIASSIASHAANTTLILPVRSLPKGEALRTSILRSHPTTTIHLYPVNLASRQSILSLCQLITTNHPRIHLLLNSASVCTTKREETEDGLEMQFGVNTYAYYLLMTSLLPSLLAASTPSRLSRIVNVASDYAGVLDLSDLQLTRGHYDHDRAYRQSKQADRALSWAASRRWSDKGVTVNACQPGEVNSELNRNLGYEGYETPEKGAETPVWLGVSEKLEGVTGKYYSYLKEKKCPSQKDVAAQDKLWAFCESVAGKD